VAAHQLSHNTARDEGRAAVETAENRSDLSGSTADEAVRAAWRATPSGFALPNDNTELAAARALPAFPGTRTVALGAPRPAGGYVVRGRALSLAELTESIASRLTADGAQPPRRLTLYGPHSAPLARALSVRLAAHTVDVIGAEGDPSAGEQAAGWVAYRGGEAVTAPRPARPLPLSEVIEKLAGRR
jgi:hypothetical protein